jgi:hypothetical protein
VIKNIRTRTSVFIFVFSYVLIRESLFETFKENKV